MSEASPVNTTPHNQGQSVTPAGTAGNGNIKAIAMLVIGLGVGMLVGAFLAPIAENFFGAGGSSQPKTATGPVKDERGGPAAGIPGKPLPTPDDGAEKQADPTNPANSGKPAPAEPAAPGTPPKP